MAGQPPEVERYTIPADYARYVIAEEDLEYVLDIEYPNFNDFQIEVGCKHTSIRKVQLLR